MHTAPPYPSGSWHIGAVIAYSMIDMIARAHRMLGRAVLFPFGLDRNGINIERTVENKTGKPLNRWDREAIIAECRKEIEAIGNGLLEVAIRVGLSADFAHTYYTDSDEYRAFSQAIFLELWPKGLFYRGERPTFWCPVCETPLAEADIEYEDRAASLVWMKFPILSGGGDLTIATTRPELLAACRAVMVHPDDARYRSLPGKKVRVPLYGQEVPIIAHSNAKPEFGSGAAMICSYGDMVDIAMFRDLRLEPVKAIDESGRMTEAAGFLKGLKVDAAREKAIDELRVRGALEKVEAIVHKTPTCSRSLNPIEFISSDAWYLKQLEFREDLKRVAQEMQFRPLRHRQLLLDWTESLTIDWPISRRRFYHTEIPLWYCKKCGETLAPPPGKYYRPWKDPAPFSKCPKCDSNESEAEDRLFDTSMDASVSNPGDDFRISEAKVGGAAKFVTKLWNVARFISSFEEPKEGKLLPTDEWILAELNHLVEASRGAYEDLNLFVPSNRSREFLWNLFAPHYMEMVKARAYEGDTGARWTLHACLRDFLRLLAPIAPFSTDKLWRAMYGGSVHTETFPVS